MNWDALGAIGEVGGAIAVVATLGYLASQVRHAKTELQGVRFEKVMADYRDWYRQISTPEAATIWAKGIRDFGGLETEERVQFHGLAQQLITTYEQERAFLAEGIFPQDQFRTHEDWMVSFLSTPGGSEWWKVARSDWSQGANRRLTDLVRQKGEPWDASYPLACAGPNVARGDSKSLE